MSQIAVLVPGHVAEVENIELLVASSASRIDRKQNGPCYQTTDEGDDSCNLQVSQEEIAIERVVIQDVAIRDRVEL